MGAVFGVGGGGGDRAVTVRFQARFPYWEPGAKPEIWSQYLELGHSWHWYTTLRSEEAETAAKTVVAVCGRALRLGASLVRVGQDVKGGRSRGTPGAVAGSSEGLARVAFVRPVVVGDAATVGPSSSLLGVLPRSVVDPPVVLHSRERPLVSA